MELGKHVLDKSLLDVHGHRAGKVDDLVLELSLDDPASPPQVSAILTGPMALVQAAPRVIRWLMRFLYALAGVRDRRPVEIAWGHVERIDVAVYLDLDREEAGLTTLSRSVARFISRFPGA